MEPQKTWTQFQEHFIKMQVDLHEQQQTSRQGGYRIGAANNAMEMSITFSNLAEATAEDLADIKNIRMENSNLKEQVALYANCLSTKESDSMVL